MASMLVAVVLGAGRWGNGLAGCRRWSVLGGFLCWFVVGERVLVLCWVLGSLVLPTVSPLVPGVSAGEGVVASGLGVGGGAGVDVVVPGPGVGRGRLGVAGCGRSPLLAEGLVCPPLCPSGVSGGPAASLAGNCWVLVFWVCVCCVCGAGGACALVCGVRLWGSYRWRLWWCVLCACAGVCAVCWWCVWVPVLAFLGLVWRLCLGVGAVCRGPSPVSAVLSPAPPWLGSAGGVSPCRPLCVPSSFCLFSASLGAVFSWCRARAFPAVVGGGGSLSSARVPSPGVSPWGGRCLPSPSGCNSVVRAIHLYPLGTNGPAP